MSFSNVNLNLYKVFLSVYECKNLTRAAKGLVTGQPNVSRSIKELECQLGVKLFHTSPKGVEPTSECVELYHKVAPALAWIELGERNINEFNPKSTGTIYISCTTNFVAYVLAEYVSEFNKKYPNISFDIKNTKIDNAIEMLERHYVELVFSPVLPNLKGKHKEIILQPLNLIYFASPRFAEKYKIQPIISEEHFSRLPLVSVRAWETERKPVAIVDTQEMLFRLVMNDLGVGLCMEQFLDCNHADEPVFKFQVENVNLLKYSLNCIYSDDFLSKPTIEFLKLLEKSISK